MVAPTESSKANWDILLTASDRKEISKFADELIAGNGDAKVPRSLALRQLEAGEPYGADFMIHTIRYLKENPDDTEIQELANRAYIEFSRRIGESIGRISQEDHKLVLMWGRFNNNVVRLLFNRSFETDRGPFLVTGIAFDAAGDWKISGYYENEAVGMQGEEGILSKLGSIISTIRSRVGA